MVGGFARRAGRGGTMAYQRGIPRLAEGSASPPEGEKRNDSNNVEQEQTEVLCTGFCAQVESKAEGYRPCGGDQAERDRFPWMRHDSLR